MKSILLSIKPKDVELIAIGKKTIEVRKSAPKEVPFKAYIYETKESKMRYLNDRFNSFFSGKSCYTDMGKVIGEFICDKIYPIKGEYTDGGSAERRHKSVETFLSGEAHNELLFATCLETEELFDYLGNGKWGYGLHITALKIYDEPKELHEFRACNFKSMNNTAVCGNYDCKYYQDSGSYMIPPSCAKNGCRVTRPPKNYIYVED